jgi:hypothetical protein
MAEPVLPAALLNVVPQALTAVAVTLLALIGRRQRVQRYRPGVWAHMHLTPPVAPGDTALAPDDRAESARRLLRSWLARSETPGAGAGPP